MAPGDLCVNVFLEDDTYAHQISCRGETTGGLSENLYIGGAVESFVYAWD